LILVESNTTGTGRDFARRAAELDVEPVLIVADPSRYRYVTSDKVRHIRVDTSNQGRLVGAVRALARNHEVAGVTSSSEYYLLSAALLARELQLPGPAPEALRDCQHKGLQRRRLEAANVPGPRQATADSEAAALACARSIGFPVVVKPVQGSGSFGVRLCTSEREVLDHASQLLSSTVNERGIRVIRGVAVEEYITGQEFSVEIFRGRAMAVVRKHLGTPPYFVETGHDIPAGLSAAEEELLAGCAIRSVEALGLGWGAAHVEVRQHDSRASVIEVNPRLAGGMIPELVRCAYGVDLVSLQVGEALGADGQVESATRTGEASIRFLITDRSAVLRDVTSAMAAAMTLDGVQDAVIYKSTGDRISPAIDFRGRIGHVLALSRDPAAASETAESGIQVLRNLVLG
jgi:argininosuccinate lyase